MQKTEFGRLTVNERLFRVMMGHPSVEDHYCIHANRARNMMYEINERVAAYGGKPLFDDDMLEAITEFVLSRSERNKRIRWDDDEETYVFTRDGRRIDEI